MAITPVSLGHYEGPTSASSYVTGSFSVTAGDILCLDLWNALAASGTPAGPTSIVGLGCTFVLDHGYNATASFERHSRWRTKVPSTTSGTITFTYAAAQDTMLMALTKFPGADTSGVNGAGAFVQSTHPTPATTGTTVTSTLAAFASNNNLSWQATLIDLSAPVASATPEAGFTELTDFPVTSPGFGEGYALQTAYRQSGDLTYTATASASVLVLGIIASEIKEAVTSPFTLMGQACLV